MITEFQMSVEEMKLHQSPAYYCAECGGRLLVAWIQGWVLRCGNDLNHTGYRKAPFRLEAEAQYAVDKKRGRK